MTQNLLQAVRRRHRFEPWEDAVIRRYYPAGGAAACLPHLPSRTTPHIASRAHRLGLAKRRQNSPNTIEPRIVVTRRKRARVLEVEREAPVGHGGRNWWRAVIQPPAGPQMIEYFRAPTKVAARKMAKASAACIERRAKQDWQSFPL